MKNIKILGSGCRNCKTAYANVEKAVKELGIEAEISKTEDIMEIVKYGVMSVPAVVIDGKVVHTGSIPDENEIKSWFADF